MPSPHLLDLTEADFDAVVLGAALPVLVDFTSVWCGTSQMLGPIVASVADTLAGRALVGQVDVDRFPALGARFHVRAVPTVMLFAAGRLRAQLVGLQNEAALLKLYARSKASERPMGA